MNIPTDRKFEFHFGRNIGDRKVPVACLKWMQKHFVRYLQRFIEIECLHMFIFRYPSACYLLHGNFSRQRKRRAYLRSRGVGSRVATGKPCSPAREWRRTEPRRFWLLASATKSCSWSKRRKCPPAWPNAPSSPWPVWEAMLKSKRKPALFAAFCVQPYPAADPDLGVSGIGDPSAGKSLTDRWAMGQCEDFVANSAANFPRQGKASVCKLQAPLSTKDCKRDIHIFFGTDAHES